MLGTSVKLLYQCINRLQLHKHVLVEVGAPGACIIVTGELKIVHMIKREIQHLTLVRRLTKDSRDHLRYMAF